MSTPDYKKAYKTIMDDHFTPQLEISFIQDGQRQTLHYEKAVWRIDGVEKGLRYGENPGQEAALYRLVNGNLALGEVQSIQPGRCTLASDAELLQSGKHPGKTNLTDVDSALNILRYLMDEPRGNRQAQQSLRRGARRHAGGSLSARECADMVAPPSAAQSWPIAPWTAIRRADRAAIRRGGRRAGIRARVAGNLRAQKTCG